MKIVVAPDSFKGCLSAKQVADAIADGILSVLPNCEILKIPLADGGEGTLETLVAATNGEYKYAQEHNSLMKSIKARYGVVNQKIAVVEIAEICGISMLAAHEKNPMIATSFGAGEIIFDAIAHEYRDFIICLGGSATNDAGVGLLHALGFKFLDIDGNEVWQGGVALQQIAKIDFSNVLPQIKSCKFRVACDVTNVFYGKNGASYVFAKQKGATPEMIAALDAGMMHFAKIVKEILNIDVQNIAGSGAAGGIGAALSVFLNAKMLSGINLILDVVNFENAIRNADYIITGEGKIDAQSLMGKVLSGVLYNAQSYNVPIVALGGSIENEQMILDSGVHKVYAVTPSGMQLHDAMQPNVAKRNIQMVAAQFAKEIK